MVAGTAIPLATDFRGIVGRFTQYYLGSAERPRPFVGRERELAALDAWLADPRVPRLLLLAAEAGRGKSALLVQWAARIRDWPTILLPISIRFETNRAELVLPALAVQLAQLFGEELPPAPFDALHFYRDRIAQYLARLDGVEHRCLIVLDGIDEAADWRVDASLLPAQPPPGLRIVVSARLTAEASTAAAWRTRLGWDPVSAQVHAVDLDLLGAAALRALVETLVERLGLVGGEPGIDALSRRLAQLSNGDPLLLSLYAEDIGADTGRDLASITQGLSGRSPGLRDYFEDWIRRSGDAAAAGRDGITREVAEAALLVLACAAGPMRHEEIVAVLGLLGVTGPSAPTRSALTWTVARFVIGDGERNGYVLGHPRFADHLRESHFSGSNRVAYASEALESWCFEVVRAIASAAPSTASAAPSAPAGIVACATAPYVLAHAAQHLERSAAAPTIRAERAAWFLSVGWRAARMSGELGEVTYSADIRSALDQLLASIREAPGLPPPEWFADAMHAALALSSMRTAGRHVADRLLAAAVSHGVIDARSALALAGATATSTRVSTWLELMPYLEPEVVDRLWGEIVALLPQLNAWIRIGRTQLIVDHVPSVHLPALLEQVSDLLFLNEVDHVLRVCTESLGPNAVAALKHFVATSDWKPNVALAHAHLARIGSGTDREYHVALAEAVRQLDAPIATMAVDAVLLECVDGERARRIASDWLTQARAEDDPDRAVRQFGHLSFRVPAETARYLREELRHWLESLLESSPELIEGLARLASGSNDPGFIAAVFSRVAGMPDDPHRHSALTWLAPDLDGSELNGAVRIARETGSAQDRAESLTRLARRAPEPLRSSLIDEAQALIEGPEVPTKSRVWLLGSLQSAAPDEARRRSLWARRVEAARAIDDDRERAESLAELSMEREAENGASLAVEALRAARRIEDDSSLLIEKLRLGRRLDAPHRASLIRAAYESLNALPEKEVLSVLAVAGADDLLTPADRTQWAQRALQCAGQKNWLDWIVDICDAYRAEFPRSVHVDAIATLDTASRRFSTRATPDTGEADVGVDSGWDRIDAAPWAFHLEWMEFKRLPAWRRALALGGLLRRARGLPGAADRASALQLFPRFHRWRCRHVLKEALAAARAAQPGEADTALLSIAELLPPDRATALHRELLDVASRPDRADPDKSHRHERLLLGLAERLEGSALREVERAASSLPEASSRFAVEATIALRGPPERLKAWLEPWLEPSAVAEIGYQLSTRAVELMERADPELKRRVFCTVVGRAATMLRRECVGPLVRLVDGLPVESRRACATRLLAAIEDVERAWP